MEDKDCDSSYQEKVSQIYILRLDYSRILSCIKKKKLQTILIINFMLPKVL